jgi:cytochrome c oxidase subunit III
MTARVIDASAIREEPEDFHALVWWGTIGMIVIESTMFVLAIGSYFYLRMHASEWPSMRIGPPSLTIPSWNLAILLLSIAPAVWADKAAHEEDLRGTRWALALTLLMGLIFLALRVGEFRSLHSRWNSDAYSSINWTILGLHTAHVAASLAETAVILAVFLLKPVERRHFLDARLDGVYWYFVVGAWIPLYCVVFLVPRLR